MRIYNKWYLELWWWIVENKEELLCSLLGLVVVVMCIVGLRYFNSQNQRYLRCYHACEREFGLNNIRCLDMCVPIYREDK